MKIMKTLRLFLITAVILLPLTSSLAAPETLVDFKAVYGRQMMSIADRYLADMSPVLQSYSSYLDAELKKSVNTGDIKKYEKLEQEKKRFENEKTIPADSTFQKSVAQVETKRIAMLNDFSVRYVSALKAHQVSLMKAQKMEEAREAQQEVDRVQALVDEYASKLPAVVPSKGIAVTPLTSKMSLTKTAAITVNRFNTELLVGNAAYENAPYLLTEIPKELKGYFFTQQSKRKEAAVEFEVTDGGIAYCFGYSAPDSEWKETSWNVGINFNGNVGKLKVFRKTLIKGIYTLPKGTWLLFQKK